MKPFNLEQAINGKAFYLQNGFRGVIKYCVNDLCTDDGTPLEYCYIGYTLDEKGFIHTANARWNKSGDCISSSNFNVVGMVEEVDLNQEETSNEFNLEEALAGKPVKLRNGQKALLFYCIPDHFENLHGGTFDYPFRGLIFTPENRVESSNECWTREGKYQMSQDINDFDIIGMWVEPIKEKDLPKPFKPTNGEAYYYISAPTYFKTVFYEGVELHSKRAENGQCFRTFNDAQTWINFIKQKME